MMYVKKSRAMSSNGFRKPFYHLGFPGSKRGVFFKVLVTNDTWSIMEVDFLLFD